MNKADDKYSYALEFVFDCCKTQKVLNKGTGTCPSAI